MNRAEDRTSGPRALGAYQVAGGLWLLGTLGPAMWTRGVGSLAVLVALATLGVVAGVALWRQSSRGWPLTILNQLIQTLGVTSPAFTFVVVHLANLPITGSYVAKATFADSLFSGGVQISAGAAVCDVGVLPSADGSPHYALSLNLLALGLLIYAVRERRRTQEEPRLGPSSVRPPTAQASQPV